MYFGEIMTNEIKFPDLIQIGLHCIYHRRTNIIPEKHFFGPSRTQNVKDASLIVLTTT